MEEWSFPPAYNPEYFPEPGSRYWFRTRETMPAGERERAILERLKQVTRYAYDHAPFPHAEHLHEQVHPEEQHVPAAENHHHESIEAAPAPASS